jgi:hypothetical protein
MRSLGGSVSILLGTYGLSTNLDTVRGLEWGLVEEMGAHLLEILDVPSGALPVVISRYILKATEDQKVEAFLKAKGLWEEGE